MRRLIRLLIAVSSFSACDDANAPVTSDAEIAAPADTSETADGLDVPGPDTAVDSVEVAAPTRALGLNDVTFLLPPALHALPFVPVEALVSPLDFARVVTDPEDVFTDYSRVRVVAIRVDLCDRHVPGPCPADADASLRLVLQPLIPASAGFPGPQFEDVAVHAFYPIPRAELPALVISLRSLAELGDTDPLAPLGPSPALTADPDGPYAMRLADLVRQYAAPARLHRLTCFAQFSMHAALHWLFRGIERQTADGPLVSIVIADIAATQQEVLLLGNSSYQVTPIADAPQGFGRVVDENVFAAASVTDRRQSLEALAALDNPLTHAAETAQCATCHVATQLMYARSPLAGLDPDAIAGRYTSPLDPRAFGAPATMDRTLRALGYVGNEPVASQRVANESAQVVAELTLRFGAPGGR